MDRSVEAPSSLRLGSDNLSSIFQYYFSKLAWTSIGETFCGKEIVIFQRFPTSARVLITKNSQAYFEYASNSVSLRDLQL